MASPAPKIVIIGAGFAGMWAALSAARKRELAGKADNFVEIVLVAPEPTLYIRPRLYENDVSGASAPLTDLFAAAGVRYVQGLVQKIDVKEKLVGYASADGNSSTLLYDRLILASGSTLFRPHAVAGLAEYSFDADQMESALKLDVHLKSLATLPDSPSRNTVVVCGGGFTGAEIASEMPRRLRSILGETANVRVVVIERGDSINFMGPKSSPVVAEAFVSLGVEVVAGQSIASIDAEGVTTASGTRIASKTVIWTAGMRASPLTAQIPAEQDDIGRLFVTQDLKVVGVDHVYATGDTAHVATDDKGHLALMSCQHAMNLGKSAGDNAMSDLLGLPETPYGQPFYATCLALGPWGALFTTGWDRDVSLVKEEGYKMKTQINTQLIYPPPPNRAAALAAADPAQQSIA
ncbi:FAD-dependent pyridine nucleotide-disulfide oxidoreductase [Mycena albidolilacea]|uniref:FAD-dependent pyridine nucleotide-disulfide oxidoreductase n=1 Tax=Mycena albidolilacea TaxID=1033008 RepID=A0AAD7A689_9AGAR|nr:FAD-dependent pyridine nucleotide-disulfide oxidoreductase [Mycena albidolilacea]